MTSPSINFPKTLHEVIDATGVKLPKALDEQFRKANIDVSHLPCTMENLTNALKGLKKASESSADFSALDTEDFLGNFAILCIFGNVLFNVRTHKHFYEREKPSQFGEFFKYRKALTLQEYEKEYQKTQLPQLIKEAKSTVDAKYPIENIIVVRSDNPTVRILYSKGKEKKATLEVTNGFLELTTESEQKAIIAHEFHELEEFDRKFQRGVARSAEWVGNRLGQVDAFGYRLMSRLGILSPDEEREGTAEKKLPGSLEKKLQALAGKAGARVSMLDPLLEEDGKYRFYQEKERRADARAMQMKGGGQALAHALMKMGERQDEIRETYFLIEQAVDRALGRQDDKDEITKQESMLSVTGKHPPLHTRIRTALRHPDKSGGMQR